MNAKQLVFRITIMELTIMSYPAFQNQFSMRCPKCKGTGRIDVQALVYIRLVRDGTDADASQNGDHEWGAESAASCACGFHGKVYDFETSQCRNCLKLWNTAEMMKGVAKNVASVAAGDTEPIGACPECGGLCHQLQGSEEITFGEDEHVAQPSLGPLAKRRRKRLLH
jgi:hypothetical protein